MTVAHTHAGASRAISRAVVGMRTLLYLRVRECLEVMRIDYSVQNRKGYRDRECGEEKEGHHVSLKDYCYRSPS